MTGISLVGFGAGVLVGGGATGPSGFGRGIK